MSASERALVKRLVLASASPTRSAMLTAAGLSFTIDPADIDERAIADKQIAGGATGGDVAAALASAKALDVGARHTGALTLGADQTLVCEGRFLNKSADLEKAREQLSFLAGKTHELFSAASVVSSDEIVWSHVSRARLRMRAFSPAFLSHYLAAMGDKACASVGAYQIEGLGIQLFEHIEGDHHTILGMPLLPLLAFLRTAGHLPT